MDQRQKKLVSDASLELANILNFVELAQLLQIAKLVSKEKIDEIMVSVLSRSHQDSQLGMRFALEFGVRRAFSSNDTYAQ